MPRRAATNDLPKAKLNSQNLRQAMNVFRTIRPYKYQFLGGLIFVTLSAVTTMAFPYLLGELIKSAQQISVGQIPRLTPGRIAVLMIVLLTFQMTFSYLRIYLFTSVGEHAVADLRKQIYRRLILMPLDFFGRRRVGELSSRITTDTALIQEAVTVMLAEMLRGILTVIIGVALILFISVKLTLVMLSVIPVIIIVAIVFSKTIRRYAREGQDQLAHSGTIVQETLQSISNVKSFNNEWYEVRRYSQAIDNVVRLAIRNGRFRGLFVSFLLFTVFGTIVLVAWYAMQIHMDFGDLTRFVVFTAFVGGSLAGFADIYSQLQKSLGATQRVMELLSEPVEPLEIEKVANQKRFRLKGEVIFDHVSFSYAARPEISVINEVSLTVQSGQQTAIVGPSGAGKSTLVSLLLRFYEPTQGTIYFDGIPAGDIPLAQLRSQIAVVPQDVLLFGGTIYENIAYGFPDAEKSEVIEAARKANAHDFILSFPAGYETVVGERGVKLSGGQRQRIAIARAILKNPVILVLDEATSALDSESESLVQEALHNLMKDRTSFIIAHRLSTVRHANQIVVLDQGVVKELGTHESLLTIENGLYRSLSKLQFAE